MNEAILHFLLNPSTWISLLTLTVLEIVLGIDNIIFLSIVTGDLPKPLQPMARRIGLAMALVLRIVLLSGLSWIASMTAPVFSIAGQAFSWRDLIMIGGGLFLLWKSTDEVHVALEGENGQDLGRKKRTLGMVVLQIAALDLVFSLDSIITAVGMSGNLPVMVGAIVIAMAIMLFASGPVSDYIEDHPTIKMLALSFIMLVGVTLLADGFGYHIPRGYLYFSIAFSFGVEMLNLRAADARARKRALAQQKET